MDKENSVEYGIIGADTCMGDHKVSVNEYIYCIWKHVIFVT